MSRRRPNDKNFYAKRGRVETQTRFELTSQSLAGFLVFHNETMADDKRIARQVYRYLNEQADAMYGPEFPDGLQNENESAETNSADKETVDTNGVNSEPLDVEAALEAERQQLVQSDSKSSGGAGRPWQPRRFKYVSAGSHNFIYIEARLPSVGDQRSQECVVDLANRLCQSILDGQNWTARFISRIVPVQKVCRTDEKDLKVAAEQLLNPFLQPDSKKLKYCVWFKARMNNCLLREDVYKIVNEIVDAVDDSPLTMDSAEPDLVLICEVIKGVCCLAASCEFNKFKRYNMASLAESMKKSDEKESNSTELTA